MLQSMSTHSVHAKLQTEKWKESAVQATESETQVTLHERKKDGIKQGFCSWRQSLSYMIWHRDCIHTHHHTEIQIGFEVHQKATNARVVPCFTILIPEEVVRSVLI